MLKHFAAGLFALAALLAGIAPAAADKRVALVIGNSAYENVPRLTNPSNDASDVAAKLKALGFEVVEGIDLGKRDMEKRIRAFAEALSGADVGLFYYAGHGLQVDQRNFLAPIDAQLESESDLDFEAVQLDLVLKNMVRNAATSLVFLDACRDNPLAANLAQVGRSLDVGRGLARIETPASMMIVYATEPGKVALDGTGRNSPFTGALLRHIDTEGASIGDVMIAVRNDVLSETSGKQRPFESASLTGQFFFKPKPKETADKASSSSDEIAVLRQEIARLQAVWAHFSSRSRSSSRLSRKSSPRRPRPRSRRRRRSAAANSGTTSRLVGVEPPKSGVEPAKSGVEPTKGDAPAPPETSASTAAPAPSAATPRRKQSSPRPKARTPKSPRRKATRPPRRRSKSATREQLAQDMLVELSKLGCYSGRINSDWNTRSRLALDRFNRHARLDLSLDKPQQASLDALKDWKGTHCPARRLFRLGSSSGQWSLRRSRLRRARPCALPRAKRRPCKPCGHAHSLEKIMAATEYRAAARLPLVGLARTVAKSSPSGRCRCTGTRAARLRRQEDVAQIDEHVAAHRAFAVSRSSARNSFHSVTTTATSAPVGGLERAVAPGHAGQQRLGLLAALRVVDAHRARPFSCSMGTMTRLGASRMSSVLGLKVTPSTAIGLAARAAAGGALDAARHGDLALGVDRLHLLDERQRRLRLARGADQRRHVLGEAGAAIAGTRMQELVADAPVGADGGRHLLHIGADRLAQIGDLVDEADLHREEGVGGIFGELGRFAAHEHHRRIAQARAACRGAPSPRGRARRRSRPARGRDA